MSEFVFRLNIFDPEAYDGRFNMNVNKTTDTTQTTGNDLSPEMKTYYEKRLIELAEPELIHDQFADKYPIPRGNGKTIEFRKFAPLAKALTPLTEGVTPEGKRMSVTAQTATVAQYGDYVALSDVLELTALDPMVLQATRAISTQAGKTLDTITREIINGGTNVLYAPAGSTAVTSRTNLTGESLITIDVIRNAVLMLKRQNAPTFDGGYIAIIHPDVAMDVRRLPGWLDLIQYGAPERAYNGEIGKIEGVRFIENTEAKIWAKGSGAGASGNTNTAVYSTLFIGKGAYATTEVTGGGLQHFVKQKGSAGTEDPLDQRSTVGWKAIKVSEILIQQYLVRVESSSTMQASAIVN